MSTTQHYKDLPTTTERGTTVGIVQKEIRQGMSQEEVAEVLGSPNIVTGDAENRETWIYDKISSEVYYSNESSGVGLLPALIFNYSKSAGATSSTQKTLTVIIKFKDNLVDSYSYHASKF